MTQDSLKGVLGLHTCNTMPSNSKNIYPSIVNAEYTGMQNFLRSAGEQVTNKQKEVQYKSISTQQWGKRVKKKV